MDASLRGNPFRPAMGRYSLLPSASNWSSVSEEAENVTPVVEGTLYFVLFLPLLCYLQTLTRYFISVSLLQISSTNSKAQVSKLKLTLIFPEIIHLSTVVAQLNR